MPPQDEIATPEWVCVARVVTTHGLRGELVAELETDFPARFASLERIWLARPNGPRTAFALGRFRFHKGRVLLTLDGIGDRDAARAWVGAEVQVPRAERMAAPPGAYYLSDLAGCAVRADGIAIGDIEWVETSAAAPPLLHVRGAGGRELLIPFAREFVDEVDLERRAVAMRLPAGLLDINE